MGSQTPSWDFPLSELFQVRPVTQEHCLFSPCEGNFRSVSAEQEGQCCSHSVLLSSTDFVSPNPQHDVHILVAGSAVKCAWLNIPPAAPVAT